MVGCILGRGWQLWASRVSNMGTAGDHGALHSDSDAVSGGTMQTRTSSSRGGRLGTWHGGRDKLI